MPGARCRGDASLGLAVSDELATWRRVGTAPHVGIDPRWYTTLTGDDTASETWRDPLVLRDPGGDG